MRPTTIRQSALRAPLNTLLGTDANVRLLRLLTQTSEPVTVTHLAREAGISPPGAYRALEGLRSVGIVERLGRGARGQVRVRKEHPLAPALASLFDAERRRADQLLEELRAAAKRLSPPPRAVWLFGPVAEQTDGFADPLQVGIIDDSRHAAPLADVLRHALAELEIRYDVTIDVRALTKADLAALPESERTALGSSLVILGLPPDALLKSVGSGRSARKRRGQSHDEHDQHLLHLAREIAAKLKTDPTLIDRALHYIRTRAPSASAGERKELLEWERILRSMSLARLCEFLVDPGPRATRLRQTLPFLGVVSKQGREAILKAGPK